MIIYHTHHIIPKHMGGTDDPSNLVRLTIEEHAEAHRILYETYGNEYDRAAWLGLSGRIDKQEASRLAEVENGKRAYRNKTGIFALTEEQWLENRKKAGAATGKRNGSVAVAEQKKNQTGMFGKSMCPHCGKVGNNVVMRRWHFDKCKFFCFEENLQTQ